MVEARVTPEVADRMITAAAVPSDGAYTAVGTYDYHEIIQLVAQLSALTSIPVPKLLYTFGVHFFGRFVMTQGHSVFQFNTNKGQCQVRLGREAAARGRNVGVACPSQ